MWNLDRYDKLKPFGFPIHGAIDGYSRRILWLRVTCETVIHRLLQVSTFSVSNKSGEGGVFQELYVVIMAQKIQLWLVFSAFLGDTRLML